MIKPKEIKSKRQPEAIIQDRIIKKLRYHEWIAIKTHGGSLQQGFPDIYAMHTVYGQRWIEVKRRNNYKLTTAQLNYFPIISQCTNGVWILTSENEYERLFGLYNWYHYIKINHTRKDFFPSPNKGTNPEAVIEREIKEELEEQGWTVMQTQGSIFQKGLPDLYAVHPEHRQRWIEVKRRNKYQFTGAQLKYFPLFSACKIGIWILTGKSEIPLLFEKPNWETFL